MSKSCQVRSLVSANFNSIPVIYQDLHVLAVQSMDLSIQPYPWFDPIPKIDDKPSRVRTVSKIFDMSKLVSKLVSKLLSMENLDEQESVWTVNHVKR